MQQALPPFSETRFMLLFRSLPTAVCIWLSQTAAAWERHRCSCRSPAAPPGLPATAQPSGPWPGSFSSLLSPLAGMLPLGSAHIPLCCFTLGSLYTHGNKTSRRCRVPRVRNNGAIGGFAGTHYKMLMEMLFKELLAFN